MAGSLFVVCVPTKEYEAKLVDQDSSSGLKTTCSFSNLRSAQKSADLLGVRLSTRSKSEESLLIPNQDAAHQQEDGTSRREMFIGPWRVDASDLPTPTPTPTPRERGGRSSTRSAARSPRSPLADSTILSRSDPDGLGTRPAETPVSNFKKRRHRFLEEELERLLKDLNIKNAVWCMGRSRKYNQVLFSIESGEPCEEALHKLAERGIGVLLNSVVSVLPCALYYQGGKRGNGSAEVDDAHSKEEEDPNALGAEEGTAASSKARGTAQSKTQPRTEWERFVQSVRARLTVAQVVEGVRANAIFTFDFLLLLIVAALTAALGLLENSTVILVASMLISPLMGPVMAATFGTMINDKDLKRMGLVNECLGLLLCVLIGFFTGMGVGFFDRPWPTREMLDRGQLRSLWVNVFIAVLSGAGIAIALLRDNTGSLVGVAISASLLPPAVNAGLLWAMSLVYYVCSPMVPPEGQTEHDYSKYYSDSPHKEMAVMGGISLCITFINIVFIYITGIIMLKIKEVAPSQAHQLFWKYDVKIARDYNTTIYGASAADILRTVVNSKDQRLDDCQSVEKSFTPELARMFRLSSGPRFRGGVGLARDDPHYLGVCPEHQQLTWSPNTLAPGELPSTVRELQGLYRSIRQQQVQQRLGQGQGQQGCSRTRRSSFSSGGTPMSYPSWRLGSSDGYRCSLAKAVLPTGAAGPSACTPPFNNMPTKERLFVGTAANTPTGALTPLPAFKTPHGAVSIDVPSSPAVFFTPVGEQMGTPLSSAAADSAILSVDNETLGQPEAAVPRRPAKKRRFVVTRAEDTEMLLPLSEPESSH